MIDTLLELETAAHHFGISVSLLRVWVAKRKIGIVRISPNHIRVPTSEVNRIIAAGRVPARLAETPTPKNLNERVS
jgi:predicted site-specific integrase-resolvase